MHQVQIVTEWACSLLGNQISQPLGSEPWSPWKSHHCVPKKRSIETHTSYISGYTKLSLGSTSHPQSLTGTGLTYQRLGQPQELPQPHAACGQSHEKLPCLSRGGKSSLTLSHSPSNYWNKQCLRMSNAHPPRACEPLSPLLGNSRSRTAVEIKFYVFEWRLIFGCCVRVNRTLVPLQPPAGHAAPLYLHSRHIEHYHSL